MTQTPTSTACCVLGMHRSGTSALTRVINLLGVHLGNDLLGARPDNPAGFWEHRQLPAIHNELMAAIGSYFDDYLPLRTDWEHLPQVKPFRDQLTELAWTQLATTPLWGFKDPRTCRLLPLWREVFDAVRAQPVYLLVLRNPDEIAQSLAVRNGYAYNKSLLLTLVHLLDAERETRGQRRVIVKFDDLIGDWQSCLGQIGATLGLKWPVEPANVAVEINAFLDPALRHHHSQRLSTASQTVQHHGADVQVANWTYDLFDLMSRGTKDQGLDYASIDNIAQQFHHQIDRLGAWRQVRSTDQELMKLEAWSQHLDATANHFRRESEALRLELAQRPPMAVAEGGEAGPSDPRDVKIQSQAATIEELRRTLQATQTDLSFVRDALAKRDQTIVRMEFEARQRDVKGSRLNAEGSR